MRTTSMMEDMRQLQGTCKQIACGRDRVTLPTDEQGWHPRVTFVGDTIVVTLADGSSPIRGIIKLGPTRDPKTIGFTDTFSEDADQPPCWLGTLVAGGAFLSANLSVEARRAKSEALAKAGRPDLASSGGTGGIHRGVNPLLHQTPTAMSPFREVLRMGERDPSRTRRNGGWSRRILIHP